eukprot:1139428-Pelagomonas_calceolata.AAC.1
MAASRASSTDALGEMAALYWRLAICRTSQRRYCRLMSQDCQAALRLVWWHGGGDGGDGSVVDNDSDDNVDDDSGDHAKDVAVHASEMQHSIRRP